jgi:hypothetical protein
VGGCQFLLVPPPGVWAWEHAFLLNLGLHAAFEVVENTPPVIRWCRSATVDKDYKGDTVVNSLGDLVTFAAASRSACGLPPAASPPSSPSSSSPSSAASTAARRSEAARAHSGSTGAF